MAELKNLKNHLLLKRKVQAATLLEVLVSMVIIMIVFVLAMGMYTRVTGAGFSLSQLRSQKEMEQIIRESIRNKDWENQSLMKDSIAYQKTASAYAGYEDLVLIEVKAEQNGKLLGTLKQIVKPDEPLN